MHTYLTYNLSRKICSGCCGEYTFSGFANHVSESHGQVSPAHRLIATAEDGRNSELILWGSVSSNVKTRVTQCKSETALQGDCQNTNSACRRTIIYALMFAVVVTSTLLCSRSEMAYLGGWPHVCELIGEISFFEKTAKGLCSFLLEFWAF